MGKETLLLKTENICKKFGKTVALNNVNFELCSGEIHALMGENGAGKSTLGKIFAGIYAKDGGHIFLEGKEINVTNPKKASELGISIVLQEFNTLPDLSVAENLFISNDAYYKKSFIVNKKKMISRAKELLSLFDIGHLIDPREIVKNLSIAQMQILEILKAVNAKSKIIILDEPTAALSKNEVEQLFVIMRRLKKENNIGFIIVSHRIEEIYSIADRITVLRDGLLILNGEKVSRLTENDLVRSMVGREVQKLYGSREFGLNKNEEVVFKVENLSDEKAYVQGISFEIRKGEILGLTGQVGAGRTEIARCIFGIDKLGSGKIYIHGKKLKKNTIKAAIKNGLGYVPEDRKQDGLILSKSISNNISYSKQNIKKNIILNRKKEIMDSKEMIKQLNIKLGNYDNDVDSLSGGNQQKVLLAKWLILNPEVLIVDEPTRGIDISAKAEVYAILNQLSKKGVSILVISSELSEVLGMCDKILVMRDGKLVGELSHEEATEQNITILATMG
jgi:ABC-type sugar transport system ATPase subunit